MKRRHAAALVVGAVLSGSTRFAAADERPLAADLREEVVRIPVTVRDRHGRQETRAMPITIYRPAGGGPHPLAVFNHGRAEADRRAQQGRSRPERLARYLVRHGFVVLAPTRVGYGENHGDFDPEDAGGCFRAQREPMAVAASDQAIAAAAYARGLPYVDASRWIVIGQSVGGLASVATVWRDPPGLVGGINFSGGAGGSPKHHPGEPCAPWELEQLLAAKAPGARQPMLWLYWDNDLYWGAQYPRRWHRAWTESGGQAEFHLLPASGQDGHLGWVQDMDRWVPLVDRWLAERGFARPAAPPR